LGLAALSVGCSETANTNANLNANRNANAAIVTNTNANLANANAANMNAARPSRNYNITREEYNKNESSWRDEANRAGDALGKAASDGWIHFKVRGALFAEDDLRDSTINVDVENAVVTLRGSVTNADQKARAEKVAKVEGATRVVNKLTVGSATSNANTSNANRK
jgi:osmotically-inducible protein OsmY